MADLMRTGGRAGVAAGPGRGARWTVNLAGGDGVRLRPLTRAIAGDDRPKQFCPVVGEKTRREAAFRGSSRMIAGGAR